MNVLLSLDPGVNTGCCLLEEGRPQVMWTLRGVTPLSAVSLMAETLVVPDQVVIEVPDAWTRGGRNMGDLLSLQGIAFTLMGWFQSQKVPVEMVKVRDWKGRKSKGQTKWEVEIEWPGVAHNDHERDALALGVWWWKGKQFEKRVLRAKEGETR